MAVDLSDCGLGSPPVFRTRARPPQGGLMRRGLAVGLALLLVAGGYAGLDIEDRAPGILTLDPPPAGAASSTSAPPPARAASPARRARAGHGREGGAARRGRPAGRGVAGQPAAGRRHAGSGAGRP